MNQDVFLQIAKVSFWNPWSTSSFIAKRTGFPEQIVSEHLENQYFFEGLTLPILTRDAQPARQKVYMLNRSKQLEIMGLNMKPTFMAQALMMSYSRLNQAREVISFLNTMGAVSWAISPWRPTRKGSLFDGLLKMVTNDGKQMLLGLVVPFPELNEIGYEHFLKVWEMWRKKTQRLPSALLLWEPKLTLPDARRLSMIPLFTNGDIACYVSLEDTHPGQEDKWLYLNSKNVYRTSISPWDRGIGMHPALFKNIGEQQFFSREVRKTRHPGAETFGYWVQAKKQLEMCNMVEGFLSMRSSELEMFRWLSQYPALDQSTYAEIVTRGNRGALPRSRAKNEFDSRMNNPLNRGYAKELENYPSHYVITEQGMKFYGHLSGLDEEILSKNLGFPGLSGKFSFQQKHQDRILKIIGQMAGEGIIESLGTESNRFYFYEIQRTFLEPIKKIEIRPDITGIIRIQDYHQYFWLEVDRGTRKGRKIIWKLEKMFLIFHAKYSSFLIPPIFFIIDCEDGKNENRIRYIAKKLTTMYQKFPNTPLQVMLTSAELMDQIEGAFLTKRIWRRYYLGKMETTTRSLEELLSPAPIPT